MLSPAESSADALSGPAAWRSFSMVAAQPTVLPSIRPWKSLMFSRLTVTSLFAPGVSKPTTSGSWSLERNWSAV